MPHSLNLDGWETLSTKLTAPALVVRAEYLPDPAACPRCGGPFKSAGPYPYTVVDIPHEDRPVLIEVRRRRYTCQRKGGRKCPAFTQPLPHIVQKSETSGRHAAYNMTRRALASIENRALRHDSPDIARDFGIARQVVDRIRRILVQDLNRGHVMRAPIWLGVDEKSFAGRKRLVLTDLGRSPATVIDMLADDSKASLVHWLTKVVPNPGHIETVTMDARDGLRHAVNEALPLVRIILDRAHVSLAAARAVKRAPAMAPALTALQAIWDLPTPALAAAAFDRWAASLDIYERVAFAEFLRRWEEWRSEILGYFDSRQTNAGAEAMNARIETLARNGQHFSFETFRIRVLFDDCRPNLDLIRCDQCGARGRDGTMTVTDVAPDATSWHAMPLDAVPWDTASWKVLCRVCHPEPLPSGTGPIVENKKLTPVPKQPSRKRTPYRTRSL